jgi:hypothetical protein
MRNTRRKPGEVEKKIDDNTSPRLELRKISKEFFIGLINQVSTSLDVQIGKINEELAECNINYHDTIL